jgi:cell division septation protein DedD
MGDRAGVVPQLLGAAVGIVLGAALLFALLGMLRGDDPTPEVVADPTPTATAEPSPTATDTPSAEPTAEPTATASPTPTETPTEAPTEEPTEEPPAETVDPASVSIQVLDAIGGSGGAAAAQEVAEELRTAGYNVVVVNRAGTSYEVTTVFWTAGQEAGGRQVAAALGTSEAEETPDEVDLSDTVDVHVVVGADRA